MFASWLLKSLFTRKLGEECVACVCLSAGDYVSGGFHGQLTPFPLCLKGWEKGVVFINGQNLGRYWNIGPQETLYLPGAWLDQGINQVGTCSSFPALGLPRIAASRGDPRSWSV